MAIKASLPPGFRFHPTDSELVLYYLKRKIMQKPLHFEAVSEIDLYKYAPWDLPEKSCLRTRDRVWYFFSPRDRKYTNGQRSNRATSAGFWKTTGNDRPVLHDGNRTVGMKKTLIFHKGKAPKGERTDWVMYEYRLEDAQLAEAGFQLDSYVVVKIFHKSGPGPKAGDQYGAPFDEQEWEQEEFGDITIAAFNPKSDHQNHNNNDTNHNDNHNHDDHNNTKNDVSNSNSNSKSNVNGAAPPVAAPSTLNLFSSDRVVGPTPTSQQTGTATNSAEPMDVVVLLNELICDSVVPMEVNYENDPGAAVEGIFEQLEDLPAETGAKSEEKSCSDNEEQQDLSISSSKMALEIGNEQFVELNDFLLASGFSFYGSNDAFAPAPHYSPCFR